MLSHCLVVPVCLCLTVLLVIINLSQTRLSCSVGRLTSFLSIILQVHLSVRDYISVCV